MKKLAKIEQTAHWVHYKYGSDEYSIADLWHMEDMGLRDMMHKIYPRRWELAAFGKNGEIDVLERFERFEEALNHITTLI